MINVYGSCRFFLVASNSLASFCDGKTEVKTKRHPSEMQSLLSGHRMVATVHLYLIMVALMHARPQNLLAFTLHEVKKGGCAETRYVPDRGQHWVVCLVEHEIETCLVYG